MSHNNTTQKNSSLGTYFVVFGSIGIFLILVVSFFRVYFKDYELRKEIERTQTDVHKLEKRKIESLEVLKRLQSDLYVQDRAREELQAVKQGEMVLVVPGLTVSTAATASSAIHIEPEKKAPLSNSAKW